MVFGHRLDLIIFCSIFDSVILGNTSGFESQLYTSNGQNTLVTDIEEMVFQAWGFLQLSLVAQFFNVKAL